MEFNVMGLEHFREATCPACGHYVAVAFFDGGQQPLATIAWPESIIEARTLPKLPLDFVRCTDCGHVYNQAFDYTKVPYSHKPNLMFNDGTLWSQHIVQRSHDILNLLPPAPTVVDVGYGDGSFLNCLRLQRPDGRFIGFDPHGADAAACELDLRKEYFDAMLHLKEIQPDIIVSRHVLEHLTNPLGFLQRIAAAASALGVTPLAYFEVPCIDNAIAAHRTVDFYYEHNSQFTTTSFVKMLTRCQAEIIDIGHSYNNEVIFGIVRLGSTPLCADLIKQAADFHKHSAAALGVISQQLAALHLSNKRVAVWGGTGKSAAFMCRYGVDANRFPIVVDSDAAKVGTFVPGTGQYISEIQLLQQHAVQVIIIPSQWRAVDILREIHRNGITYETILIEHDGALIDFIYDQHPYQSA
jgi:hypothetical protein